MQDDALKDRVREVLIQSLVLDGLDPADIQDDTPFGEEFGLDSVDVLAIVLGLEEAFEIKIDSSKLQRENFESVDTLTAFISRELAGSSPASN